MRVGCGAWRKVAIVLRACLLLALQVGLAQKKPATGTPEARATSWWRRPMPWSRAGGRTWPSNCGSRFFSPIPTITEALAGLAKDYKLMGSTDKANDALERLRKINPNDPNIAKIEAMTSTRRRATSFARPANWPARARPTRPCASTGSSMAIVRRTGISRWPTIRPSMAPPRQGSGHCRHARWPSAIPAIRAMPSRWASMLTYDAKTRAEGIRILKRIPRTPTPRPRCARR
jgi:hypothetical protein